MEAEKMALTNHHLYHALLGELYTGTDNAKAIDHLQKALALTKTTAGKNMLSKKIVDLEEKNSC